MRVGIFGGYELARSEKNSVGLSGNMAANSGSDSDSETSIKLHEYTALKYEQTTRITLRETSLYLNILVTISIFAVYFQSEHASNSILLCIPHVSFVLFWIYRSNDAVVTDIRKYIVGELDSGRNLAEAGSLAEWFGWERHHRRMTFRRVLGKAVNLLVGSLSFLGPGVIALMFAAGVNELDPALVLDVFTSILSDSQDIGIFWWIGCIELGAMAIWMLLTTDLFG